MIVAFDLDDTLYRELDYVDSGFSAVAEALAADYGVPAPAAFEVMRRSLEEHGRGQQLDDVLHAFDLFTVARRNELLRVYRTHAPQLQLPDETMCVLTELVTSEHRMFLVTDGHSRVQARKIDALGLHDYFEHCYITWRYGRESQKPSTRCFELMLRRARADASQLVYVGDNPHKDFIGVRSIGGATIRVMTGAHAAVRLDDAHEADRTITSICHVGDVIDELAAERATVR